MISFIVIGRNEGWKLLKCFDSIFRVIEINKLEDFEVIYVDSNSIDSSLSDAVKYKGIRVFQISGEINAAVARNVGAMKSIGEVLFFIDGDMEISAEFLKNVYNEKENLYYDFISSNWINRLYDFEGNFIKEELYKEMKNDSYEKVTGGLFLINRESWKKIGGMNDSFRISEDIDIGLRLAKKGVYLLRKKDIGAIHHTISYMDNTRRWQDFFKWNHIYGRSYLYRKHLLNKFMWTRMLRNDYTFLVLVLLLVSTFVSLNLFVALLGIYVGLLVFRSKLDPGTFFFFLSRDISVIFGLFFFFPRKKKYAISEIKP